MADTLDIRPLAESDLHAVAQMEYDAWHGYYQQYENLYSIIKDSVTHDSIEEEWKRFIGNTSYDGPLITGEERKAYVALIDNQIVGIGACSAYKENTWEEVDILLCQEDGSLQKTTKFQNLYIHQDHRGKGIGHHLGIVRADDMLKKGYSALFLTTYADATKTNAYHLKNGMKKVHEYESLQTYRDEHKVRIACFLNTDLQGLKESWEAYIEDKIAKGKAITLSSVTY